MRTSLALVVAAGLVAGLAGCSVQVPWAETCEPVASGAATDLVTVTGDFGETPTVQMPSPVRTTVTQVQELIPGEGDGIIPGQMAVISYNLYNGRTGDLVGTAGWDESEAIPIVLTDQLQISGLYDSLRCAPAGSRIVSVISPDDAFAEEGGSPQAGIEADDSLVFVADVETAYLAKSNGFPLLPESGLPLISLAPSGQPGMTKPNFTAPSDLRISTLKQGGGAVVEKDDSVVLHYTGWLFDEGTVFDSSWDKGAPAVFVAGDGSTIPGFEKALLGAQVGSQVIAIIPPDEGYGDAGTTGVPPGSTLVFVIDVLGIDGE